MNGCVSDINGRCIHLKVGGDTSSEKCSSCAFYTGRPRGLGDIVHLAAKFTGAKIAADAVSAIRGKPCGCGERRAAMNAAVPFADKPPQDEAPR